VTPVERSGLGLDGERHPGRRDRDAVDIATASVRQRVAQPPPLCLQASKSSSHLILGPRADTALLGQTCPAASVGHQPDHDQQQNARDWDRAGARGDDGNQPGGHARDAADARSAQRRYCWRRGKLLRNTSRSSHRRRKNARTLGPARDDGGATPCAAMARLTASGEKADDPRGRPFRRGNGRKIRENQDGKLLRGTMRNPCKLRLFRSRAARLKIVVSPVRVRVSPSLGLHVCPGGMFTFGADGGSWGASGCVGGVGGGRDDAGGRWRAGLRAGLAQGGIVAWRAGVGLVLGGERWRCRVSGRRVRWAGEVVGGLPAASALFG
jgi:hypothetical protein